VVLWGTAWHVAVRVVDQVWQGAAMLAGLQVVVVQGGCNLLPRIVKGQVLTGPCRLWPTHVLMWGPGSLQQLNCCCTGFIRGVRRG